MANVDIICLCNWHGIGGAQLNAGMLTAEFQRRGYAAELGFLFEREPEARQGMKDYFVALTRFGIPKSGLASTVLQSLLTQKKTVFVSAFELQQKHAAFVAHLGSKVATLAGGR